MQSYAQLPDAALGQCLSMPAVKNGLRIVVIMPHLHRSQIRWLSLALRAARLRDFSMRFSTRSADT